MVRIRALPYPVHQDRLRTRFCIDTEGAIRLECQNEGTLLTREEGVLARVELC